MATIASLTTSAVLSTHTPTMEERLNEPAMDPPTGVQPVMSTYNPEQAGYYACAVLVSVVPGTLLALRLYTKIHVVRRVDITDYLTILAFFNLIAMLVVGRLVLASGGGQHQWNITVGQLQGVIHWIWLNEILYGPAISLIKTVILLQYQRIFAPRRTVDPFLFISSWIIIVLVCLWNFVSTWVNIFACNPQEKFWNNLIDYGYCLDFNLDIQLTSMFNIIVDVLILLLPTRAVWRLSIPLRKKFAIVSVFAIGLFACIANGLIIFYSLQQDGDDADVSYNIAWMGLWAFAEIGLGLIVICALSIPKFLDAKGKKLRIFFSSIVKPFTSNGSFRSLVGRSSAGRETVDAEASNTLTDVEDVSMLNPRAAPTLYPYNNYESRENIDLASLPPKAYVQGGTTMI